jgi:acetyl-CoA carboxylase biotin carboxyl carrier protein
MAIPEMPEPRNKVDDVFDVDRIRKLIDLMKEHDLAEVDLRQNQQRIRLSRGGQVAPIVAAAPALSMPIAAASSAASAAPQADVDGPHIAIIKSPMVGTFYSRPNPNSKNFVEVGSDVSQDSVVCIIEAMKVFNEIPAELRGKIVSVLVKNEEAVDFGKPLFKVDTRG